MKDKIILDDIKDKSLNELTDIANKIIENLENQKNLFQVFHFFEMFL